MNLLSRAALLICLFPATLSFAQAKKPRVEKEPQWVTIHTPSFEAHQLDQQADGGYIELVYDKQISVPAQSTYYKRVVKILSESGVQNRSEINVDFDPSYSDLVFHTIRIYRDKEVINKLQLPKIKTFQQEDELNRFLYNGSLSSVLFLEDVRKGDIIEYSYTIKGFNPVFKGRYAAWLETSFSIPIYNLYYKVVMPKGRSLTVQNNHEDIKYTEQETASEHVYDWHKENLPAQHLQDMLPAWYDPYGMITVSEYKDWNEVKTWARQLFPVMNKLSGALLKKVEDIRKADSSKEKQVLAALRFVQDDVRYLGIEMGQGSHKPHLPNQVFSQRFGDCKDKSYLLCTMLKELGIEASPVLINTTYKEAMSSWLPSPTVFDHCTLRMRLNGRDYYFDPTISYQRGRLRDIAYPDYEFGLVINDSSNTLTAIPPQHNKGLVDIKEEFTIPDMKGAARLIVKTTYTGSFADDERSSFGSNSIYEMQKSYKAFYAAFYEKIRIDSLTYVDDDSSGKFATKEYYTIDDFWDTKNGGRKAYFSPFVISGQWRKPSDLKRTMPFRVMHPARYNEEVVVYLPEEWNYEDMVEDVKCTAFRMRAQAFHDANVLRLKYEYESLKDHVLPNESDDFLSKLEEANRMQYTITKSAIIDPDNKTKPTSKRDSNIGFIILAVLVISGSIIWWTQRRR